MCGGSPRSRSRSRPGSARGSTRTRPRKLGKSRSRRGNAGSTSTGPTCDLAALLRPTPTTPCRAPGADVRSVEETAAVGSELKRKLDYSDLQVAPGDGPRYELV